ncbi:hypothetical protein J2S25_002155 [Mesobacillus stamsii]|uniref:Uncharacterized protein n=1 Tax=Mesobacillus stamsii TaxID=225347 RepID=A0ABU0FX82_9BACI|nr:hypothetical protein [Mesobacillus stamsii]
MIRSGTEANLASVFKQLRKAQAPWSAPTSAARLERHVLWLAGLAHPVPRRADH